MTDDLRKRMITVHDAGMSVAAAYQRGLEDGRDHCRRVHLVPVDESEDDYGVSPTPVTPGPADTPSPVWSVHEEGLAVAAAYKRGMEDARRTDAKESEEDRAALDAWAEAERTGTETGHVHCPDCGCDPEDHLQHADGCRRIGASVELQCGPPWNPWPGESPAVSGQVDEPRDDRSTR